MTKKSIRLGLALSLTALLAVASAGDLDAGKSTLSAEFTQIGVPVSGAFRKFSGSVSLDPAKPAEAKARVEIDMASFDLDDKDYNAEVRKKEWFDTAQYPKASFEAQGLKTLGDNKFEASGKLSLKGKVRDLKVPVTLKTEGATTVFDGVVPLSRKDFDIGDAAWNDVVEDGVKVKFHIVVPAAP